MRISCRASAIAAIGIVAASLLVHPELASGNCNVIPGRVNSFRGALGEIDRPFAMPGDFVSLTVRQEVCDGGSLGVADHDGSGGITADDVLVTVLFEPPQDGPRNAVVIASDCAAIATKLASCEAQLDGAARCVNEAGPGLVATHDSVRDMVRFRFPDTDEFVGAPGDDRTLAGPATIAVTPSNLPLPCAMLTANRCAAAGGLVACVDQLYPIDGTCSTSSVDAQFGHFVGLPPPNDYKGVCETPGTPCDGDSVEVRLTTDADGNALVPFDYRGVLVRLEGIPVPRLVRGSTLLDVFAGGAVDPLRISGTSFLSSFSPEGHPLPPIFTPLWNRGQTSLLGSVDAPLGVFRISRRGSTLQQCTAGANTGLPCNTASECPGSACGAASCHGGANHGLVCTSDAHCAGSECGPSLFELRDRYVDGAGPVVVAPTEFTIGVDRAVPIDGQQETDQLFVFTASEAIENETLNGDADGTDLVITLRDRTSGAVVPIGSAGRPARAVTTIRELPFHYPAMASEGDLVAFLEPEPHEGDCATASCDGNANGAVFDTLLRVYRVEAGNASPIGPGVPLAADAEPLVDGRPIAISAGRVFFRLSEAASAQQTTRRVSVGAGGVQANARSDAPDLSPDGRFVAFQSAASNLVAGDTNAATDVFVRDLVTGTNQRVNLTATGGQNSGADTITISRDARHAAFFTEGYLVRRDRVSGDTDYLASGSLSDATISADGSAVAFTTSSDNVLPLAEYLCDELDCSTAPASFFPPCPCDRNGLDDVYVFDSDAPSNQQATLASVAANGFEPGDGSFGSFQPSLSADGSRVAFVSSSSNLTPQGGNGWASVFVRDRAARSTVRADVSSDDSPGNFAPLNPRHRPLLSADGTIVAFEVYTPFVSEDTDFLSDAYVRELSDGVTELARVAYDVQASSAAWFSQLAAPTSLSSTGRYVGVASRLHPRCVLSIDSFCRASGYVFDRLTGLTALVALTDQDLPGPGFSPFFSTQEPVTRPLVADDGRTVVFADASSEWVAGDTNSASDVFVRGPDPSDTGTDWTGNGGHAETLLAVLEPGTGALHVLCPADEVALAAGGAVYARPEAAGAAPGCPGGDLNGDGDTLDRVAHLSTDGATSNNLELAVDGLAMSESWIAALASEAGEGTSLNGDADLLDRVVAVSPVAGAGASSWTLLGRAADAIEIQGSMLAFAVPESAQGADLNGDGDRADRVLHAFDASAPLAGGNPLNTQQPVVEFVLGAELLAFRTREGDLCDARAGAVTLSNCAAAPPGCSTPASCDRNGDGDCCDAVMQTYVPGGLVANTGQAASPCDLEEWACTPGAPYRVTGSTVTFLTLESQQGGHDLNGDLDEGGGNDLVQQVVNAASTGTPARTLGMVMEGLCADSGAPCTTDSQCDCVNCCFVPPGVCVDDNGVPCDASGGCEIYPDRVCGPRFTCIRPEAHGSCGWDADCGPSRTCIPSDVVVQRLVDPVAGSASGAGDQVFVSAGACFEDLGASCTTSADCNPAGQHHGAFCDAGSCRREHGACATAADCPVGVCSLASLRTATAADSDGDALADPIDDCPSVANADQSDSDADGIGDACDLQTCGNAVREGEPADPGEEECDDGNRTAGDGCDASCQLEAPDCSDGVDNDGDGLVDHPSDPGCWGPLGTTESPPCSDLLDNDGDGRIDHPADPGCFDAGWGTENPACQDGIDNDAQPGTDFDGGAAANGDVPLDAPDPDCVGRPYREFERSVWCGLGAELVILLPAIGWRSRRWRRRA